MANFVTHIPYFKLALKKSIQKILFQYVPHVRVEVISRGFMLLFHQFKPWLDLLFNK